MCLWNHGEKRALIDVFKLLGQENVDIISSSFIDVLLRSTPYFGDVFFLVGNVLGIDKALFVGGKKGNVEELARFYSQWSLILAFISICFCCMLYLRS